MNKGSVWVSMALILWCSILMAASLVFRVLLEILPLFRTLIFCLSCFTNFSRFFCSFRSCLISFFFFLFFLGGTVVSFSGLGCSAGFCYSGTVPLSWLVSTFSIWNTSSVFALPWLGSSGEETLVWSAISLGASASASSSSCISSYVSLLWI